MPDDFFEPDLGAITPFLDFAGLHWHAQMLMAAIIQGWDLRNTQTH
jgi:hypothetical protein